MKKTLQLKAGSSRGGSCSNCCSCCGGRVLNVFQQRYNVVATVVVNHQNAVAVFGVQHHHGHAFNNEPVILFENYAVAVYLKGPVAPLGVG